jgi:hypothetical protein
VLIVFVCGEMMRKWGEMGSKGLRVVGVRTVGRESVLLKARRGLLVADAMLVDGLVLCGDIMH